MRKRFSVSVLTVVVAAAAGCGGGGEEAGDPTLTVYVSLSQLGPDAADGADGARMALAEAGGESAGVPVEARFFDDMPDGGDGVGWTPAEAAANARTATQDSTAIAYLGEFESGATRASLPITNSARLLQVSPASAAEDLVAVPGTNDVPKTQPTGERSFGRVIPSDTAQGAAAGAWARELGWDQVRVEDDGTPFGEALAAGFESELPGSPGDRRYLAGYPASFRHQADDVVVGAEPSQILNDAFLALGDRGPSLLDASYVTSAAIDPSQLPPAGREFARAFEAKYDRRPGPYAAYGYEAMAVIIDSIDRASDPTDRAAVIDAFFATTERDSVLGTYSIDELGETTLERMTGYELRPPGRRRPIEVIEAG